MITTQHWIQYFTDEDQDGNSIPYYYNIETTKTQWEMPEEIQYYHYARYDGIYLFLKLILRITRQYFHSFSKDNE